MNIIVIGYHGHLYLNSFFFSHSIIKGIDQIIQRGIRT